MKYIFLLLFGIFLHADSISIQESIFDYKNKFEQEHDTKLTGEFNVFSGVLITSVEDINRFGLNGLQFGTEFYSKFNEKDWGYVSLYVSNNKNFLPIYDVSGSFYKSLSPFELGFGLKRMSYELKNVNIVKAMFNMPLFKSTTLMETLSYVPQDNTRTLNTKVVFNNEKNLKMFYSLTFGSGVEELGFLGLKEVNQELHQVGIEYKVISNFSIGLELVKEFYKELYTKTGGSANIKFYW